MVNIKTAREIASFVRLSEDKEDLKFDLRNLKGGEHHRDTMLRHGVLLSESVTPVLEERLSAVCRNLGIPRKNVSAFVYNSADVQADCLIDTPETCVLRFTSGLVNLMDGKEFQFVAGHELGHFLLGHAAEGDSSQYPVKESSEEYMTRRARELSADRIGFLSIENLDESIKAIIKTASGLGNRFLRFDVSKFLSQTDIISNPSLGESRNSTHPSMLIRCRALLWFSMSVKSIEDVAETSESRIREVDSRVVSDLEKFVDGQIRLRRTELENDAVLWKSALLVFHSGSFKKEVQKRLSEDLGEETLNGIRSFFELYDRDELPEQITRRLDDSLASVYREFPTSAKEIKNSGFERAYKIVRGQQSGTSS